MKTGEGIKLGRWGGGGGKSRIACAGLWACGCVYAGLIMDANLQVEARVQGKEFIRNVLQPRHDL